MPQNKCSFAEIARAVSVAELREEIDRVERRLRLLYSEQLKDLEFDLRRLDDEIAYWRKISHIQFLADAQEHRRPLAREVGQHRRVLRVIDELRSEREDGRA